jgi:DNA-binding response OmpR family regulator
MKILLVEDDAILAEVLEEFLTDNLHVVERVSDGEAAWEQLQIQEYDLILLDVMLPKLDGIQLCRQLRSHKIQQPILIVTALDSSTNKIAGLDAGADDYLVKPFDFQELLARIRALQRRGGASSPPILEWGQLRIDPATYEASYGSQTLHLTPKEYSILELLSHHGRRILSRNFIIERIWLAEDTPTEDTVKTHVRSLRQKLSAVGAPDDFIETVRGLGYRLKAL